VNIENIWNEEVISGKKAQQLYTEMGNLTLLLGVLAAILGILLAPWDGQLVSGFYRIDTTHISQATDSTDLYVRRTKYFPSVAGVMMEGWHYLPNKRPVEGALVILGHGIGSQKDFGLERYSSQYAKNGISSMSFDYRYFGGSDGEPRNLIMPTRQVEDWTSAFEFAKSLGYTKIFLHGTSYGGGHVITAGAILGDEPELAGVISQVPFTGGPEGARANAEAKGLHTLMRVLFACAKDTLLGMLGMTPVGYRIITDREQLDHTGYKQMGLMEVTSAQLKQYLSKHPKERLGGWKNMIPARGILDMLAYKPIDHISNYSTPMLVVALTEDEMCKIEVNTVFLLEYILLLLNPLLHFISPVLQLCLLFRGHKIHT